MNDNKNQKKNLDFSSKEFEDSYTYRENDLGVIYTKDNSTFKVWAPTATAVKLNLYKEGSGDNLIKSVDMIKGEKGVYTVQIFEDLNGIYYTYSVNVEENINETIDAYAYSAGVNGDRGMILDLLSTNPEGFENDKKPEFKHMTDAIIYETHVRDISSDSSAHIKNVGKFLGLVEKGTKNDFGETTGLDHMKELGITHIHLLPSYDYATVDESRLDEPQFNWGYDPKNYNLPEGSYSTDPFHGEVRVKEFKETIMKFHENGIRVIMDVVYNHTYSAVDSAFEYTVPGYYYRKDGEKFSNASGCGNETASERSMVRKYFVDSVMFWAKEYHIDGFRFDLMAVHDIETMNVISEEIHKFDPSIILYGEGWADKSSVLPENERAFKKYAYKLDKIAVFSDDMRDAIKGHVFEKKEKGYVSGRADCEETIKFGIVGSTENKQIDYEKVLYSDSHWANSPEQCVNYVSCHDNWTLWDKLNICNEDDSKETIMKKNKMAAAIVLTSQGIPLMVAGEEILRSKKDPKTGEFIENSFRSPDVINSIKWNEKHENKEIFEYYKGLIEFRKAHSALRMYTTEAVQENINFIENVDKNVVAYTLSNNNNFEEAKKIMVIFNANKEDKTIKLESGEWGIYVNDSFAGTKELAKVENQVVVSGISSMVLVQ